jgi:hypothetical protein
MKKVLLSFLFILTLIGFASAVPAAPAECVTGGCWQPFPGGPEICGPMATPGVACSTDNNACTEDVCGGEWGQCLHTPIAGCCNSDSECDDSNAGTLDSCISHVCSHYQPPIPTPCDDGNACTTNDMNLVGICMGAPITCNDNNQFTTDSCNPATGCVYTPVNPTFGPFCGDAQCNNGETCSTCSLDCGACPTTSCVPSTEVCDNVDNDCDELIDEGLNCPVCGNQICETQLGENEQTCASDCSQDPPSVPEFGLIAGLTTVLGTLGIFFFVRRSK